MSTLAFIIIFTLLGSVVSLIGGVLLLIKEKLASQIAHFLAAFAAGALLGSAFLDLLPEAFHELELTGGVDGEGTIFLFALFGILVFFFLERAIHWFHHHHREHEDIEARPTVPLVMFGDTIHNFIDGVAIAATFMVDIQLGIVTTLAVAAHEIPQEIGDFGILLHAGLKRGKILWFNLFSALAAVVGAVLTYILGAELLAPYLPILLALTAGFFIYIAGSDLLPHIHKNNKKGFAVIESGLLLLGVALIYAAVSFLHH